jgi:hypothetical protein
MQALRNSLEMNTRTQISYMGNEARKAVYKANESIFNGYRRIETLDSRTCVVCGLADQKIYKTLDEAPTLPEHPNCRGLYLPVIKGMEEWRDDDERASVDGPVPAKTTWQDWLSKQSPEVQKSILGPTRFAAYKSGMKVSSFVSDGKTLNLRQLMEKEGLELFGAGLKNKSWQAQDAYAETYYEAIRNRKASTDIDKIAKNTGFSQNKIKTVRDHVFMNEHDFGNNKYGRFPADWQIAQAWQRMEQGWKDNGMDIYKNHDILLLKHELEEWTQETKNGYNIDIAHEKAEAKYAWDVKLRELD